MNPNQLPYFPVNYQGLTMKRMNCTSCKGERDVFEQDYTTIPQNSENKILRVREVFCAACGTCLERTTKTETA